VKENLWIFPFFSKPQTVRKKGGSYLFEQKRREIHLSTHRKPLFLTESKMTDNRAKSKNVASGNHLLNFTTYERPTKNTNFQPRRRNNQSFVPFNKERFVNSQ
jgi:hypothetical protein